MLNVNAMATVHRIFSSESLRLNGEISLVDDRARYVSRTLRLKESDRIRIFDGTGGEFEAVISRVAKGRVDVLPETFIDTNIESPVALHLVQGVSRGERMDFVVQKATELGVVRITPVLTEFTVVRLDADRAARRREHWQRVAESACEQCGRNLVPIVGLPTPLRQLLAHADAQERHRIVMDASAPERLAEYVFDSGDVDLLIGPEGGLSPSEREAAAAAGFDARSIGPRILRTETAAIAAVSILQSRLGDM